MQKTVIILGSARSKGNTYKIVEELRKSIDAELIDLRDYRISPYDYEHKNRDDDFLPLIRKIVKEYDLILFATPIYWYTMSARMKIFFDRISDCLQIEKETGRKLRGKKMAALCCGSIPTSIDSFFNVFKLSAGYLGMEYQGDVHTWIDEKDEIEDSLKEHLTAFAKAISS
jgi:multimeric flavodoxin WrbA